MEPPGGLSWGIQRARTMQESVESSGIDLNRGVGLDGGSRNCITIEALRKQRQSVRMLITKTVKDLDIDLATQPKNIINLRTKLGKLNSYEERIAPLDKMIIDFILADPESNDESFEKEVTIVDDYAENLLKARLMIEMALDENAKDNKWVDDDYQSINSTNQKRYKLPKIELQKFSGKVNDWLSWWAFFERIHIDEQLSAADKFQYLLQCVEEKTRAHDLVKAFPASAANYPKVVEALNDRRTKTKDIRSRTGDLYEIR